MSEILHKIVQNISHFLQENKSIIIDWLAATLMLMSASFYNEFPLLTGDSAVYISSGFDGVVPSERPIFYGWFIRCMSLGTSLWGAVIVQNAILAFLLLHVIKLLFPNSNRRTALGIIGLTAMFTGAVWESNKLMADIFIAYELLAFFLVMHDEKASKWKLTVYTILLFYSASTHNSHAVILLLASFIYFLIAYIRTWHHLYKKILVVFVLSLLAPLGIALSNQWAGNGFTLGKATPVFIIGKMCENGILKTYLDENCPTHSLKLCPFKDSLPHTAWQFVWHPESPVLKTGGWDANLIEYNYIIKQTLIKPKYLWMHLWKSVLTTMTQLAQITSGDALFRYEEYDNTMLSIRKYFPHEINPALWTRQRIMELDFKFYSRIYGWFFLLSTMWLWLIWKNIPDTKPLLVLLGCVVLFIVLNAFVTANLANISSRLQARIFWVLPFWNILVLTKHYVSVFKKPLKN